MSPKLPRITAAELMRALRRDGWEQARQSGSHVIMKHPTKSGYVIVPMHPRVILKLKTLQTILSQAGLTPEGLHTLL